jgi:hypothetical protein
MASRTVDESRTSRMQGEATIQVSRNTEIQTPPPLGLCVLDTFLDTILDTILDTSWRRLKYVAFTFSSRQDRNGKK